MLFEVDSVSLGLMNPKSPENVGAVMRAAGCFGIKAVYYSGDRFDRAEKFSMDTRKARYQIPLIHTGALLDQACADTKIIAVELVEGAMALPEFQHPSSAYYMFGPEDGTLSQELIDRVDFVVYIPTLRCMNLAATINVVLYDRLAKSERSKGSDELIRSCRDTNNTVKVSIL